MSDIIYKHMCENCGERFESNDKFKMFCCDTCEEEYLVIEQQTNQDYGPSRPDESIE